MLSPCRWPFQSRQLVYAKVPPTNIATGRNETSHRNGGRERSVVSWGKGEARGSRRENHLALSIGFFFYTRLTRIDSNWEISFELVADLPQKALIVGAGLLLLQAPAVTTAAPFLLCPPASRSHLLLSLCRTMLGLLPEHTSARVFPPS